MILDQRHYAVDPAIEVIALRGRLGIETTAELTTALQQALKEAAHGLILDMSAVEFISSSGLRMLFTIYRQAEQEGKRLAMFGVRPAVYKILKIAGYESGFHVYDTEAEAAKCQPR